MRADDKPAVGGGRLMGTLRNCVGVSLRFTENEIFARTSEILAPLGLTPGSFTVLVLISENPEATQNDIGEMLVMKKSNFATMIARIERRGLVARAPCADDGRKKRLSLTPSGQALVTEAVQIHDAFNATLATHMGQAAHDQLVRLLDQLRGMAPFKMPPRHAEDPADSEGA